MKATSSIYANLGNSREAMVKIHKYGKNPPYGHVIKLRATRAILSRDRTVDDEIFCTASPIHLRVQSMYTPGGGRS